MKPAAFALLLLLGCAAVAVVRADGMYSDDDDTYYGTGSYGHMEDHWDGKMPKFHAPRTHQPHTKRNKTANHNKPPYM